MKPNKLKRLVMGASVVMMLLVGIGSTTANAQNRVTVRPRPIVIYRPYHRFYDPFWSPYWGPRYTYVNPVEAQRESGYSDGRGRGKDDAKDGKPNAPDSHKHYTKSNSLAYREAFIKGYDDGYREKLNDIRNDRG